VRGMRGSPQKRRTTLNLRKFPGLEIERRNIWRLRALPQIFLVGDRLWGYLRLAVTLGLVYFFVQWERDLFTLPGTVPIGLFSLRGLRFWIVPVAALAGALFVAAHYVKDVYELPRLRKAIHYILSAAYALVYPRLLIVDGEKVIKEDEINLLDQVGGPGYVLVSPGSIVLLERLTAPSNVYAAGAHFVSRLERVKETATLEDQHGFIESVSATTKDGIEVNVRAIQYRYRLKTGRKYGDYNRRTPVNPFPYSIEAMRNLTYGRTVSQDGFVSWHDAVRSAVVGSIVDYITQHQIDHLTAPEVTDTDGEDPRAEIHKKLFAKRSRERLRSLGAELLWVDIGHIDIKDEDIDAQRVGTWQAHWMGQANVVRAVGEAQQIAANVLGRAEAHADLLVNIMESLEQLDFSTTPTPYLQDEILARTIQVLDSFANDQDEFDQPGSGAEAGDEDPDTQKSG